uniref:GDT1 family protein n=1 Tax=Timema douglasi TaxID=61478 RepID=A0A7R8ZFY4_TIMDO|nr:unnamed protein product [Timema douglasi]
MDVYLDQLLDNARYEKEAATSLVQDPESGVIRKTAKSSSVVGMISRIFLQSFTLTFLAEWGDRSQLATIILAAREDVVGVAVGGVLGHSLCTGLAVLGGRMIAQRISVRTGEITYSDWRSGVPVVRNHSVIPRPKRRVTRNSIRLQLYDRVPQIKKTVMKGIFHQFLCINSLHHSEIFWYTLDSKLRTTQPSFNHNKALNPVTKPATHNPAATFSSNITDSIHTIKGNHIIQQPLFLATSPTPSIPSKAITSSSSHFF